ncbi:sphingomyelin phosphodiesterase [Backusella circina FSU 941]|nr:sphingomyelin phosphodiesterase [Backusella circina FSU 941]
MLKGLKFTSYLPETFFISALKALCRISDAFNHDVCVNFIQEQGPIIHQVIKKMDVENRGGHLFCGAVLNSCPYPATEPWSVTFPKPKPNSYNLPISIGKNFTVLQLSDFHMDIEYLPGSEANCNSPLCCRAEYTDFKNISRPASIWGDYKCDSPPILINSLLRYIPQVEPNIAFGILTGDVPSHEIWSTLPTIKTKLILDESYRLLHSYFDSPYLINSTLYPTVGNHDAAPANLFPLDKSTLPLPREGLDFKLDWLYKSLTHSWRQWVSQEIAEHLGEGLGSYALRPTKGLKLISMNTIFCYTLNWWMYETMEKNPNGIFTWLINELQDAEDKSERVWIIGHIPPSDSTCFHDYSDTYYTIIDRYSHIIAAQFFGHTHRDEFAVFYKKDKPRNSENAVSISYISPSITPYTDLNPGFRTYKVDTETFEILDTLTYIADLDQRDTWRDQADWHFEYSARDTYSSVNLASNAPLTPSWWHNVTQAMETNQTIFDHYYKYRTKSSSASNDKCNSDCKENVVCNCRAGNSKYRCDFVRQ